MNCIYKHKDYPELEFNSAQELLDFLKSGGVTSPTTLPVPNRAQFATIGSDAVRNNETGNYELGDKTYESVTGKVIPKFQTRPYTATDTAGQRLAKNLWKDTDPSTLKLVEELSISPIDMETAIALEDKRHALAVAKGTIFHKIIHLHFANTSAAKAELQSLYEEHRILPGEFEWLTGDNGRTITNIIKKTGTDYFNGSARDKILTEQTVVSDVLG